LVGHQACMLDQAIAALLFVSQSEREPTSPTGLPCVDRPSDMPKSCMISWLPRDFPLDLVTEMRRITARNHADAEDSHDQKYARLARLSCDRDRAACRAGLCAGAGHPVHAAAGDINTGTRNARPGSHRAGNPGYSGAGSGHADAVDERHVPHRGKAECRDAHAAG